MEEEEEEAKEEEEEKEEGKEKKQEEVEQQLCSGGCLGANSTSINIRVHTFQHKEISPVLTFPRCHLPHHSPSYINSRTELKRAGPKNSKI